MSLSDVMKHRTVTPWAAFALLGLSCATSATGRQQLLLLPNDELRTMGEKAFVDVKTKSPASTEPTTNAYVQCVVHAVLAGVGGTASDWEVVVFEDDAANAFALPGGKVGVYTGLLKVAKDQHQLAAVIGHEVAHVTQQHGNERVSQAFVAEGGLAVASAAIGTTGEKHNLAMAALGLGAQYGVLLPFGRTQESEADVVGLDYMARAGFDPAGAIALWQNMQAVEKSSPPEFLSTHPAHDTRIHNLQQRMPTAVAEYQEAKARGGTPHCNTSTRPVAAR
jgi:predicted Zn-dependent protease